MDTVTPLTSPVDEPVGGPQPPRTLYLAFEGGGAKGIVHVGALAAVETRAPSYAISGAAGTSAGAIVAGLVAAGYQAEGIFNPDSVKRRTILTQLGFDSPTDLFGQQWAVIAWLRRLFMQGGLLGRAKQTLLVLGVFVLVAVTSYTVAVAVLFALFWVLRAVGVTFSQVGLVTTGLLFQVAYGALASVATLVGLWLLLLLFRRGICSTETFAAAYDKALRAKIGGSGPYVTFQELPRSLKVVATCLDTADMEVFDAQQTPHASVADAVAASSCLPIIFAPARVRGYAHPERQFYDGGLVSNLPVWTFDEERRRNPDSIVLAFSITEEQPARRNARWSNARWIAAVVRAAVFGGSALNTRGIDDLGLGPLPSQVGVLAFDMTWAEAVAEFRNGERIGQLTMKRTVDHPRLLDALCNTIRATVAQALSSRSGAHHVRIALTEADRASGGLLRLRGNSGFYDRSDETLTFPLNDPGGDNLAGAAWKRGELLFVEGGTPVFPGAVNRRRAAQSWHAATWRAAIPLPGDASAPPAVLWLDGDGDASVARQLLSEARFQTSLVATARKALNDLRR